MSASYMTLDAVIAALQAQKEAGTPGDTAVFLPTVDNNGRGGFLSRVESVNIGQVAKTDFEKNWAVCKTVSNRGISVVVVS